MINLFPVNLYSIRSRRHKKCAPISEAGMFVDSPRDANIPRKNPNPKNA